MVDLSIAMLVHQRVSIVSSILQQGHTVVTAPPVRPVLREPLGHDGFRVCGNGFRRSYSRLVFFCSINKCIIL